MKDSYILNSSINRHMNDLRSVTSNQGHVTDLPSNQTAPTKEVDSRLASLSPLIEGLNLQEIKIVKEMTLILAKEKGQLSNPDDANDFLEYFFKAHILAKRQEISIDQLYMHEKGGDVSGF